MWPFSNEEVKHACQDIAERLLVCLQRSDCCQKLRKTPNECLKMAGEDKEFDGVPEECLLLKSSLTKCKLSMMDARSRFRGKSTG